jgi:hypothetical protein
MHISHIITALLSDVIAFCAAYLWSNMQRSITMVTVNQITINNEVVDIAAIEAQARQMRAEALAEFGRNFRAWLKSLNVGFAARAAH